MGGHRDRQLLCVINGHLVESTPESILDVQFLSSERDRETERERDKERETETERDRERQRERVREPDLTKS